MFLVEKIIKIKLNLIFEHKLGKVKTVFFLIIPTTPSKKAREMCQLAIVGGSWNHHSIPRTEPPIATHCSRGYVGPERWCTFKWRARPFTSPSPRANGYWLEELQIG